jgi:hypothetical protein
MPDRKNEARRRNVQRESEKGRVERRRFLIGTGIAVAGILVALPPAIDWLTGGNKPAPATIHIDTVPVPIGAAPSPAELSAPAKLLPVPYEASRPPPAPNNRMASRDKPKARVAPSPGATKSPDDVDHYLCVFAGQCPDSAPGDHRSPSMRVGEGKGFRLARPTPLSPETRKAFVDAVVRASPQNYASSRSRRALEALSDAKLTELARGAIQPAGK